MILVKFQSIFCEFFQLDANDSGLRSQVYAPGERTSCKLLLGTEDGKLVNCDVSSDKDDVTKQGLLLTKPQEELYAHFGPVKAIAMSPILENVFLTLADWSFACKSFKAYDLYRIDHSIRYM